MFADQIAQRRQERDRLDHEIAVLTEAEEQITAALKRVQALLGDGAVTLHSRHVTPEGCQDERQADPGAGTPAEAVSTPDGSVPVALAGRLGASDRYGSADAADTVPASPEPIAAERDGEKRCVECGERSSRTSVSPGNASAGRGAGSVTMAGCRQRRQQLSSTPSWAEHAARVNRGERRTP